MTVGLFRDEVLSSQRGEWLGSIRLQAPRLGWAFFYAALVVLTLTLGLLFVGHYTRNEQVAGTLVPSSGLMTFTPAAAGVVTRVLVREGDRVHAGQPLVEISGEQTSASLGDTSAAITAQLQLQRASLQSDLRDQKLLFHLKDERLRSRLALMRRQIAQMEQQIALQRQRADSAMALYHQLVIVAEKGVVSKLQVLQQHDSALQGLAQLRELSGQLLELQGQAQQLQDQIDETPLAESDKSNSIERQLADVAQSLARNATQRAVVLRATADGTVTNVIAHPGESVSIEDPLVVVLPAQAELLAELWLPSKAMGFIHTGQPVLMRYDAYPYQKFGLHTGRVREISRSAVSASQVSRLLGQAIATNRYRVMVSLDAQNVLAYGQLEPLRPGMTLDADVLLDRRRLIEWVLEPLYGLVHQARTGAKVPRIGTP